MWVFSKQQIKKIWFLIWFVPQLVKNLPAMQETWVRSLSWEDPLEKGKATHSSMLAWRIPLDCIVHGVAKSWTWDWATELNWTELNQGNRDTDTFWILTWQVSHISWIGKGHVQCSSVGKESACNIEDLGSIPELGRSPGEGNGNPLQCSCLENPSDGRAWWAAIYGVAQSRTRLQQLSSSSSIVL